MWRFLVFFEPIEILDLSPEIGSLLSFELFLIRFSVFIDECVWGENNAIAVFNDGLTCHKYIKPGIKCIMDS